MNDKPSASDEQAGSSREASPTLQASSAPRSRLRSFWQRRKGLASVASLVFAAVLAVIVPQIVHGVEHVARPVAKQAPLDATAIVDLAQFRSSVAHVPEFLIPRPVSALPPPPDPTAHDPADPHAASFSAGPGRWAWAHALSGVDANETLIRISITGTSSSATVLQQLRVQVVQCRRPPRGTLVSYLGLGSGISPRFFLIKLDSSPAVAEYVNDQRQLTRAQPFPLRVTSSDQEVFDVMAQTLKSDCEWKLFLDWTAAARKGSTEITAPGGKPFRTTATNATTGSLPGVTTVTWDPALQRWI